jgi:hypothetical protein
MLIENFQSNFGWGATFGLALIPLIGQLIMRVFYLYGSLDWWVFLVIPLFWMPPLSFVPVLMGKYNVIKKKTGNLYAFIVIILVAMLGLGLAYRCKFLEYINLTDTYGETFKCTSNADGEACEYYENERPCNNQDNCIWNEDDELCEFYEN